MASLQHYLDIWNLSRPQRLATTATSHVYTVQHGGETAVLKILTPIGIHDESSGIVALRHFNGEGAVQVRESDGEALLMEYAAGDDLLPMVRRGEDADATRILGGVLNRMHSQMPDVLPEGLWKLERRFRALFRYAEADGAEPIFVHGAAIARELLDEPREKRVLHGDMHHENVRYCDGRGWLAIDPKGVLGERTFDACNILCNPLDMPELVHDEVRLLRNARVLAEEMQLAYERLLRYTFAYACLSVVWSRESGDSGGYTLRVAELLQPHL